MKTQWFAALAGLFLLAQLGLGEPMKALIIDGQNNHDWKTTTPYLKKYLEETGLFTVDVATSPAKGENMSGFKPNFSAYKVIVSNYNGEPWSQETQDAFEKYMRSGGGFVSVHAANNAFPEWKEYNQMIGLGGWGDRNEKSGPYVRFVDGKIMRDLSPGVGGSHGAQHAFLVEIRDPSHPITAGLPVKWMHAKDELYDRLRGPAENLHVLATAYSDPDTRGAGFHEPMLMTISYGKGRVFHTTLGHALEAIQCVGFITTLQRGAEWAATGKVTQKVPSDFPTADKTSSRQ
jgi:type 1 glutamine amidotransferase